MYLRLPRAVSTSMALLMSTSFLAVPALAQSDNAQTNNTNDEIIVTGSILSATTTENLVGVSVLTSEELQRRMSGSLGETLKFEPGISSSFFGAGASRPIIRGQGGLRVLLLDNGIGSIDASSASPDHAAAVEPAMASRIEVIRGSGLLRFGSSASGGVINVIDGRIPDRVPEDTVTGKARFGVSSVDNGYHFAIGSDVKIGQIGTADILAHGEISHRKTDNYDIPKFARSTNLRQISPLPIENEVQNNLPNSATEATSLAIGLSYLGENIFFGGAVKDLNSEYGIPGGEGSTIKLGQIRYDFTSRFDLNSNLFEALNILGGAADYEHKEIEASGEVGTIFTNKGFEFRAELTQHERGLWNAAHGVQYKEREFSAIGEEAFVPPTTTTMFGAFSFHELDFDDVHVEAAARYEHVKHQDKIGNQTLFNGLSGSLGMDYHLSETTKLGGSFYRTERAPTTEELFSNGPHLATNQFEIGDPSLEKEIALGAEISLRFQDGGDHLTFNIFYTDYANYIFERTTGAVVITDEGDSLAVSQFTPADAVFRGFELDIGKSLGQWKNWDITTDASLEYVDANLKNISPSTLPRIPPLGVTLGISAENELWNIRTELEYAAKKSKLAAGELPSEHYMLVNAFLGYTVSDNMTLRLSALNLTNQDARQHTSFLKEVVHCRAEISK